MYFFKGEEVDLILFGFVDYDRSSLVYDKQVKNGGSWPNFYSYPAYVMVSKQSI